MAASKRPLLGELEEGFPAVSVGQFELAESIGRGSMGEVWRGRHVEQGVDVAIKVVAGDQALDESFRQAFRQEIRHVAGLSHPFIINVIDYGIIDDEAEDASLGELSAGSPYLVMEYARHGSLKKVMGRLLNWQACQQVIFALLDALAHSHARGVVHRDIKPQNVLLTDGMCRWPGIRLTDFGLAYALWQSRQLPGWDRTAGTPEYMAPEQVRADWRRYGPATDLYGIGCLVFEMICGEAPFRGNNIIQIADAHLREPMPELTPRFEVPPRLERWIETLLAKNPERRFRSAAEAACALRDLSGPLDEAAMRRQWQRALESEEVDEAWETSRSPTHTLDVLLRGIDENGEATSIDRVPENWRRRQISRPPVRLVDTGRGLFGLRRLPIFGRDGEREILWSEFRQCLEDKEPRVVLLHGPAGVGKDYLAEWLCDRAAELGVARIFRAYHEDSPELIDGLALSVEREFALTGMLRMEVEAFFRTLLQSLGTTREYDWESIAEIVARHEFDTGDSRIHFASSTQRHMAMARFMERLTTQGPIVLWLNDIQWASEALSFVEVLLGQSGIKAPIFVVMTARDDLLAESEHHRQKLDALMARPESRRLDIGPLDESTIRQLVEKSLFLESSAAYEVARHSGGNPLHAMEIVRRWVDEDLLEPTGDGYVLRKGEASTLSPERMVVWTDVVDRLLEGREALRPVLEAGAILGQHFRRSTWVKAARGLGLELPEELVDSLLGRKYIYETPLGLVFSQNLLREALLSGVRDQPRWRSLCIACAQALEEEGEYYDSLDERLGYLLIEAGEVIDGGERLLKACLRRRTRGEFHAVTYLAVDAVDALDAIDEESGPEAKRLRVELSLRCCHAYQVLGQMEVGQQWAEDALRVATELGDELLEAACHRYLIQSFFIQGQLERAKKLALRGWETLKGQEGYGEYKFGFCLVLTHISRHLRLFDEGNTWARRGMEIAEAEGDIVWQCNIEHAALVLRYYSDEEVEAEEVDALIARCQEAGTTMGLAQSYELRAEIARVGGDFDAAVEDYEQSMAHFELISPDRGVPSKINLALILLRKGEFVAAGRRAERVLQGLRRRKRPKMTYHCLNILLPMGMVRKDWRSVEDVLDEIRALVDEYSPGYDADAAFCLRLASRLGRRANCDDRLMAKLDAILDDVDPQGAGRED